MAKTVPVEVHVADLPQVKQAIATYRGIVERINDGWDYVKPLAPAGRRGVWFRFQDGAGRIVMSDEDERVPQERMSDLEQHAIYGAVVRGADTTPSVGCGGRDLP